MAVFDDTIKQLAQQNPEGLGDEYNTNLEAIKKTVDELEARYQKPNWFNIAAGFAKPQLGGFIASLGSAAEAQGKNIEQQRQMAIPIAQMRAQLGIASTTMGQNKKAADYLDNWQKEHPGQPVPQDVYEHAASISPNTPRVQAVGKSLELARAKQSQDLQAQQNALTLLRDRYTSGAIKKDQYQAELAALNANSPYSQQQAPAAPLNVPTLPNQNADTLAAQLDIPLSGPKSGTRTPEMQSAMYNDYVANGKKGPVVAPPGKSAHEVGNAIDVDMKKATPEHIAQLKAMGFTQTVPSEPWHWERKAVPQAPAAQDQSFENMGLGGEQAQNVSKEQVSSVNSEWQPKVAKIIANDPEKTEKRARDYLRASKLLADPAVQNGTGLLYKDKGYMQAVQNSIAQGLSAALGTPFGGASASISVPVETFISSLTNDPKTREKLTELNRIIINDAIDHELREGTKALGGGHTSTTEFQSIMSRIASSSDPHKLIQQYIGTHAVENDKDAKLFKAWTKYQSQPGFANRPHANFFQEGGDYDRITKEYGKKYGEAQNLAD